MLGAWHLLYNYVIRLDKISLICEVHFIVGYNTATIFFLHKVASSYRQPGLLCRRWIYEHQSHPVTGHCSLASPSSSSVVWGYVAMSLPHNLNRLFHQAQCNNLHVKVMNYIILLPTMQCIFIIQRTKGNYINQ